MTATIDRTSPIPLYFQLKQILLERIDSEEWGSGDLIPSELELQDTYGLSRTTVRQTLSDLVNEGRLHRQRGRGTFVTKPVFAHDPMIRPGAAGYMSHEGLEPGWRIVKADWTDNPPEGVRERLNVAEDARVYRIHRLRLANDEPIGYHYAYLPESLVPLINHDALLEGGSMRYLRSVPQMENSQAVRHLEATLAGDPEIEQLGVAAGFPILTIERILLAEDGSTIELLWAAYRGDQFKYRVTI